MTIFNNAQQLGSFGEFCYQKFALANGFSIEKVGILEYDFNVSYSHKVDVKSTQTKKIRFTGKRVREDISYDIVSVIDNKVTLYPDLTSPLSGFSGGVIGEITSLYEEWSLHKNTKIKSQKIQTFINPEEILSKHLLNKSFKIRGLGLFFVAL